MLALAACGPAASPTPSSPRTTEAASERGVDALDACAGLPRPPAPPAPKVPAVSLERLGAVARARANAAHKGRPLEVGPPASGLVVSWTVIGEIALSPVDVSRPSIPLDLAAAALPPEAEAALRRQRGARAALTRVLGWRDPSARAAGCLEARTLEVQSADGELRSRLASLRSPIADVLAAELALGEASSLDDPHLADLALEEALTRTARARAATGPEELAGFFARALRVEALRAAGAPDEASAEAATLVGVAAPTPSLRGEAELRAAELESDETKRASLYRAAVAAATDNPLLGFAARAGAIATLHEEEPEAALRILSEIVAAPPPGLEDDVEVYATEVYQLLLPRTPRWWDSPLPSLSPSNVQRVAETLAAESERRGDSELARALLAQAEELGPLHAAGEALKRDLGSRPVRPLSERVAKLRGHCAFSEGFEERPLHGELSLTLDARGLTVRAHPDDASFAKCLERWAPGYLPGAPALHATFSPQPVRRPAIRSTAAGTKP